MAFFKVFFVLHIDWSITFFLELLNLHSIYIVLDMIISNYFDSNASLQVFNVEMFYSLVSLSELLFVDSKFRY